MTLSVRSQASSTIREFDLIRALKKRYGTTSARIVRGIGDDAAVIASGRNRYLLTTDLLAEGIHFDRRTAAFTDIGFRAATANLSDIAAMGGTPEYLLVALAIPRDGDSRQVEQLYDGMMAACRPHRVRLIGGDTSASRGGWFVNITLVGSALRGRILFRSGAKAGDDLYVTGTLGDSRAGLQRAAAAAWHGPRAIPAGRTSAVLDPAALAANRAHSAKDGGSRKRDGRLRPSICRTDSPATSAISVRKAESGP